MIELGEEEGIPCLLFVTCWANFTGALGQGVGCNNCSISEDQLDRYRFRLTMEEIS